MGPRLGTALPAPRAFALGAAGGAAAAGDRMGEGCSEEDVDVVS
jgi:hypothetical protein